LRTRIALEPREPRDPRAAAGAERVLRAGAEAELRRGAGAGSGDRQIGQFSTKRLWRQKLGGKDAQSRTAVSRMTCPSPPAPRELDKGHKVQNQEPGLAGGASANSATEV
jgi:hypothetical protein